MPESVDLSSEERRRRSDRGGVDPRPRSGRFRDCGGVDSATAEGSIPRPRSGRCNSRGSRGGECNEPTRDPRNRRPPRTDRGAVALHREWEATQAVRISITGLRAMPMARTLIEVYLHIVFSSTTRRARCRLRRTSSLGLTMRPLRGRCVTTGGSAGHARARCTRPRATHGYFIDRSAVAEPDRSAVAEPDRSGSRLMATASRPARSTPLLPPDRNLCAIARGTDPP